MPPALSVTFGLLLTVGPVTIRNYYVSNDIVVIASQGGINFFIGNNPRADGYSSAIPDADGVNWENRDVSYDVESTLGHEPTPSEESWFWYRKGIEFVREQPAHFLALLARKAAFFWNDYEIPNNRHYYFVRESSNVLKSIPLSFGLIAPLGIIGMFLSWRNARNRPMVVFVIVTFLVTIVFFVCDRYRVPVVPFLCLFAAFTTVSVVEWVRRRQYGILAMFLIWLAALGAFCNLEWIPLSRNDFSREYLSLGIVELERGNPDEAITNFKRADSIRPGHPSLGLYLAQAEWIKGERVGAVSRLRTVLRSNPDSFSAMLTLTVLYNELGQLDSSLHYGFRSIQRKPYSPVAYTTVAQALLRKTEFAHAESILVAGQNACGDDFHYGQYLLAGIQLSRGEIAMAEEKYRSLLKTVNRKSQPMYEPEFAFSEVGKVGLDEGQLRGKIFYGLGNVFAAQGELDSAVTNLRAATRFFPDLADAWADLGVSLMATGKSKEATIALDRAISLDSSNFRYWFNKGAALSNEGRLAEAESSYTRSLSLNPNFGLTRERLLEMRRRQKF